MRPGLRLKIGELLALVGIAMVLSVIYYTSQFGLEITGARQERKYGQFTTQIQQFIKEGARRGVRVNMNGFEVKLVDKIDYAGTRLIGYCSVNDHSVYIEQTYWDLANSAQKEMLVFHELGHCILHNKHDERYKGYAPLSIMYPGEFPYELYLIHREEMIDQLFSSNALKFTDEEYYGL